MTSHGHSRGVPRKDGRSAAAIDYRHQRELVSQVKRTWQQDASPDAATFLREHPAVNHFSSLVVELAYEEYCLRRERGEEFDGLRFCERFPKVQTVLMDFIRTDEYARQNLVPSPVRDNRSWPQPGDQFLGSRIEEILGQGAFSRVYLCTQPNLGGRFAVVKMTEHDLPESEALGRFNHPHIIPVQALQYDQESQLYSLWMPFVGRSTLHDLIELAFPEQQDPPEQAGLILDAARRHIQPGDRFQPVVTHSPIRPESSYVAGIVTLSIQIADALDHAHQRGIMHGDIKPANVLLTPDGQPVLVDFNLAFGHPACSLQVGWTFPYVAPERLRAHLLKCDSKERVDERADLYAFGCLMYELLTGRTPFQGDFLDLDPDVTAARLLDLQSASIRPVSQLHPGVDTELSRLVDDCLRFDPGQRLPSIAHVRDRLQRYQSPTHRIRRFVRRRRRSVLAILLTIIVPLVGFYGMSIDRTSESAQHYKVGVALFRKGQYDAARNAFSQSLAAGEVSANAYLGRAAAAVQLYSLDRSEELLEDAIRDLRFSARLRDDPAVKSAKAYCFIKSHQPDVALSVLGKLIENGSVSADVWNNLGYCYYLLVNSSGAQRTSYEQLAEQADAAFRHAIALDSEMWQAHLNLAILALERYRVSGGKHIPRDGLKAIRNVIRLHPEDAGTFFCGAKLAGILAELDQSAELWEECLDYLEQACVRGHDLQRHGVKLGHPFHQLEDNPRFQALLRSAHRSLSPTAGDRAVMPAALLTLRPDLDAGMP